MGRCRSLALAMPAALCLLLSASATARAASTGTSLLLSGPSAAVTNQPVTLTATVQAAAGAPQGTVTFTDHGAQIPGCVNVPLDGTAKAVCTTSFQATSSPESVSARYTPSRGSGFGRSSGGPLSVTVSPSSTTTRLSLSPAQPSAGQPVTYTATVAPAYAGPTLPSGSAAFLDQGSAIPGCSNQPLSPGGSATCTVADPSSGSHSITAAYSGDANFAGSTSPAQSWPFTYPPVQVPASSAPAWTVAAQTLPVLARLPRSATLAGELSTNGPGQWQFQYGTGITYGQTTSPEPIAGREPDAAVSATVGPLSPDTLYHYRVVLMSAGLLVYGQDGTFTTEPDGRLLVLSRRLLVFDRAVEVRLRCLSATPCVGRFSIATRRRRSRPLVWARGFERVAAGRRGRIRVRLPRRLMGALAARSGRMHATLIETPTTGQAPLSGGISIVDRVY